MADFDGFWTNEKHVSFLNWIEASFVRELHKNEDRCLLKDAGRANPSHGHDHHPRLDRYLPDSADSTHDSKRRTNRRKSRVNNEIVGGSGTCEGSSRSDNASQDQVVPQLGSRKREGDERGLLEIVVPSATGKC